MSKINIKQRLSHTKGLEVGPNDARRLIQHKNTNYVDKQKFDARTHLSKRTKLSDARDKLNKLKNKPNGKELPKLKKIKSLMQSPVKSAGKTSMERGELMRTVKGASSVHTKLKGGTLTRTLKGGNVPPPRRPPVRNVPIFNSAKIIHQNKGTVNRAKVQIESKASLKRKREPAPEVWSRTAEPRRSVPTRLIGSDYDDYSTVMVRPARPLQSRVSVIATDRDRHYEYQEPMALLPNDYSVPPPRIVERSYEPEYTLISSDESRQFREFMHQQEVRRHAKFRDDVLELEARRRSAMLDLQDVSDRYYEPPIAPRRSLPSNYSYGYDVIVSNLIPVIHESEIESCFQQFGKVLSIDFINKTTAKIKYESKDDAEVAAINLDNKEVPVIFGTPYIGTKYSKQRISVRLPDRPLPTDSSRYYFGSEKPTSTSRNAESFGKYESFRDVAASVRPHSTIPRSLSSRQFPSRLVQPDLAATHSALFSNRNVLLGSPSKSFLVRRM